MTTRSASADGESSRELTIHCRLGATTSRVKMAAPRTQFMTTRVRSRRYAMGSAADEDAAPDITNDLGVLSTIDNTIIEHRQVHYWESIRDCACAACGRGSPGRGPRGGRGS